ncbi:MAG TPA: phosphoribosylanthranilate isomerase [Deinococcales bacterium]|nr:phosphoribosylanthranilate isomerase [Deinococcales bacterium]
MNRVRVKICGITSAADARLAEAHGADAIGLIFAEGSSRQLTPDTAVPVAAAAGPFLQRIGVFRNQEAGFVLETARRLRLDAVQLHGDEDAEFVAYVRESFRVLKAVAFAPGLTPAVFRRWPADGFLLDAPAPGSGKTFDWTEAADFRSVPGLVVAGGLNPDNAAEAVRFFRPYGVDTASGVETAPGKKSAELIRGFVSAVGEAG